MDFVDKYQILKNVSYIKKAIEKGIEFDDNEFELLEISLKMKNIDTLVFLFERYYPNSIKLFQYGFNRKEEIILDNDKIARKHPFSLMQYLVNDVRLKRIKSKVKKLVIVENS